MEYKIILVNKTNTWSLLREIYEKMFPDYIKNSQKRGTCSEDDLVPCLKKNGYLLVLEPSAVKSREAFKFYPDIDHKSEWENPSDLKTRKFSTRRVDVYIDDSSPHVDKFERILDEFLMEKNIVVVRPSSRPARNMTLREV
ncbi:MAG: hypothetical protein JSV39_04550 [Candidatus Aenigmatarchaeota archaeon]|nr:MAG: hypothetical protein JSV39_04550 [Candidatus Aenigmarchaeota archaeon]